MNEVTQNALAQLNKDKQAVVVDKASAKITYILAEQAKIKDYQEAIRVHQEKVAKIVGDILTADQVLGRPASVTPNQFEVAVLKAIKDRNDATTKNVEEKSKCHLSEIDGLNAAIKGCNERISKLREEVSALVADVVTAEQVLG
jgi:hypothetical protein